MSKAERQPDPQPREPDPQAPIGAPEDKSLCPLGSLHDDQLMTKRDNLGLHHGLAAKAGEKGTEHH